jgi:uncharacterized phage protein (TIGR02218 family)
MKATSSALKAHMAQGSTTLAHLVKLTRPDGFVLAVTLDHDRPLTFDGVTYQPAFGATPSTVETSSSLSVDNMDAKGALLALGVEEADIAAGLWDGCDVRVLRVNWKDLSMGAEKIKRGTFGEISIGRGTFTNEVRGITQRLQQTLGEVVSPSCRADLFDTRCGVTATEGVWKFSGVPVTFTVDARRFTASSMAISEGQCDGGKVAWLTGANAGLSKEIKTHLAGGDFELQEAMPYPIAVGDTAIIYVGCLKRATEDCAGKFDNIIRFRGFPSVPGQDQMFRGPE